MEVTTNKISSEILIKLWLAGSLGAQRDANYNSQRKLGAILIGKLTGPARLLYNQHRGLLGCEFQPDHILQLTVSCEH